MVQIVSPIRKEEVPGRKVGSTYIGTWVKKKSKWLVNSRKGIQPPSELLG